VPTSLAPRPPFSCAPVTPGVARTLAACWATAPCRAPKVPTAAMGWIPAPARASVRPSGSAGVIKVTAGAMHGRKVRAS